MGARDFRFWLKESRRRILFKRKESFLATLLPEREGGAIKSELDRLSMALYEVDHEEEFEKADEMNAKKIEAAKKRLVEAREKRRALIREQRNG